MMGTRILFDGDNAVLYCSSSDWAFGPVFSKTEDQDALERAENFLKWLEPQLGRFEWQPLPPMFTQKTKLDVRVLTEAGLQKAYSEWLTSNHRFGGDPCQHPEVEVIERQLDQGESYGELLGSCTECGAPLKCWAEFIIADHPVDSEVVGISEQGPWEFDEDGSYFETQKVSA